MPVITRFSPQLTRMIDYAAKRMGKPFMVKTNPAMSKYQGGGMSVSLPERAELHRTLPIYLTPACVARTEDPALPVEAEFAVADQVAAHLAYESGYRRMSDIVFGINNEIFEQLGEDVEGQVKFALQDVGDQISDLAYSLITHNMSARYEFDPAPTYKSKFYEDLQLRPEMFSFKKMKWEEKIPQDLDPILHPVAAKVLMFGALLQLARLHIFLPQETREEMYGELDPYMSELLLAFLTDMGLDANSHYYLSGEFTDEFTSGAHFRLQLKMLEYLVGDSNDLKYQVMPYGGLDESRLALARTASTAYDHFAAFSLLCMVKRTDVNNELNRAKGAMWRKTTDSYPTYSQLQVQRKIAETLMERNMLRAALIYQEEQFGADADLDYDHI